MTNRMGRGLDTPASVPDRSTAAGDGRTAAGGATVPGVSTNEPYDPAADGAQMRFDGRMSYSDYLRLDKVLDAQEPLSDAHDELLFIIQHQTSELWMTLAIHELEAAIAAIREGRMRESFKMLTRVARIFEQLNSAWDVLRTMTPSEYSTFRDDLGQSSGFQSWQYRAIEYLAGNKNAAMLRPHEHVPDVLARLQALLERPSLYDEVLRLLGRNGFAIDPAVLARDVSTTHVPHPPLRLHVDQHKHHHTQVWKTTKRCYGLAG